MSKFPWLQHLQSLADKIVNVLHKKEEHYQGSWQQRGGQGAFMMLTRKWDRIENACRSEGYDIFKVVSENKADTVDDIDDLIGYLLLVRAKVHDDNLASEPGKHYVDQDPEIPWMRPPVPDQQAPKHKPLTQNADKV